MATCNLWLTRLITAATLLSFSAAVHAQSDMAGGTASQNLRATGARSPGNMVGDSLARVLGARNDGRAGVEITQTSRPTSPRAQFLAEAAQIILDQVNQLVVFFQNMLLVSAGLPPIVTTDILPPTTGTEGAGSTDLTPPGQTDADDLPDRDGGRRPGRSDSK